MGKKKKDVAGAGKDDDALTKRAKDGKDGKRAKVDAKPAKKPKPGKDTTSPEDAKPAKAAKPAKDRSADADAKPAKGKRAKDSGDAKPADATAGVPSPDAERPGRFEVVVPVVVLRVSAGALQVATVADRLPDTALAEGEALGTAAARALGAAGLRATGSTLLPLAADVDGFATVQASWVALCRPDDGSEDVDWVPVADAADRADLVRAAVDRLATLVETTTIGAALCPATFTVGELREVYRAVWGVDPDSRNFHRKVTGVPDFLVEAGGSTSRGGGRPARLYRAGRARQLNPALTRP